MLDFLFSLVVLCRFYGADVENVPKAMTNAQTMSLRNSLNLPRNAPTFHDGGIWRYLFRDDSLGEDACTWRGVGCTDGIVTHFILSTYNRRDRVFHVHVAWLPNTVEYLYFKEVFLHSNFAQQPLPKELRYLYIEYGLKYHPDRLGVFNTEILPPKMEELIVQTQHAFCGTVYIPSLPIRMVLCSITNFEIQKVIVDNHRLPKRLKRLDLCGTRNVWTVDGSEVDKRVKLYRKNNMKLAVDQSEYSDVFAVKCQVIKLEVLAQHRGCNSMRDFRMM